MTETDNVPTCDRVFIALRKHYDLNECRSYMFIYFIIAAKHNNTIFSKKIFNKISSLRHSPFYDESIDIQHGYLILYILGVQTILHTRQTHISSSPMT